MSMSSLSRRRTPAALLGAGDVLVEEPAETRTFGVIPEVQPHGDKYVDLIRIGEVDAIWHDEKPRRCSLR